jgi:hypothetical protein
MIIRPAGIPRKSDGGKMNQNKNQFLGSAHRIAVVIVLVALGCFADEIFLTDGETAKTEIVDTSGCQVRMLRRGSEVTIRKNLIRKIIWKSDTISMEKYVCPEKPVQSIRIDDTPEYRLLAILNNSPEKDCAIRENAKIAAVSSPLLGHYNSEEFVGVQSPLIDLFKRKTAVNILNASEMIKEIDSVQHNFDYAFFAKKYHVEINRTQHEGFGGFGKSSQGEKKMELATCGEFVLYDLSKKEIVFRRALCEERSFWGESDYSWVGILTPEAWKKEWEKEWEQRKLDRNAKAILKRMKKEISPYLGLKD